MSFSGEVKEELGKQMSHARNCQIAEMAALLTYCGRLEKTKGNLLCLSFKTENSDVLRKYFTLLRKTYNIGTDTLEEEAWSSEQKGSFSVFLRNQSQVSDIVKSIKWVDANGVVATDTDTVNEMLLRGTDAKRAFIRGAYLAIGSMSDPQKGYHLEYVCISQNQAEQLCALLNGFEVDAKIVLRKKYYVVYIKEGSSIVDLLNIMEAHVALMNLENLRIEKEIRNSINRRVNCETANITKTINASAKQLEDIELVRDEYGFGKLPDSLSEIAKMRLLHPDATLKELGELMDPPVGKSGVNHRLRKLSEIAQMVRDGSKKEE